MCNPFFYEFQVVPSLNVFKLVCCTVTMYTTDAEAGGLALIGVLISLAGGKGHAGGHDLFSERGDFTGCSSRGCLVASSWYIEFAVF
jgi:hypothetical protein